MSVGLMPESAASRGLVSFRSVAEVKAERDAVIKAEREQLEMPIDTLAAYVRGRWSMARDAKQKIEQQLLNNLRQRKGEYRPDVLAQIRESGGSEIYMMLTNVKCRAAESWINEILLNGQKPWEIRATPIPELPTHVEDAIRKEIAQQEFEAGRQGIPVTKEMSEEAFGEIRDKLMKRLRRQAAKVAGRMSKKIADDFTEGNWEPAMKEVIKDVVTFKLGILRGPIIRKDKSLQWKRTRGKYKPVVTEKLKKWYYRVSPFDLYPGPNTTSVNSGYLCERHRMRRGDLVALKGVPGYKSEAIDLVLEMYGQGGLRDWLYNDQIRASLEERPNEYLGGLEDTIDAIEYNGPVSGKTLLEWGVSPDKVESQYKEYDVNAWLIGNYVIRAVLNSDPLGRRNYHTAAFEEIPGAFWGYGVPDLMSDVQDVCNAAARSLVNNMAIASGPQVELFSDRLPPGEDIEQMYPWKIWQTTSDPNASGTGRAMQFFSPDSHANELMKVYEFFSGLSDEYTGIPAYSYGAGNNVGGAGRTASGLSMLMTSAARGIKAVIGNIDNIIEGTVTMTYDHNMLYHPDDSIKGDSQVAAKGSRSLMTREQKSIRTTEFLNATNNETDLGIMGPQGRAELLREAVKSLEIPGNEIIPEKEELNQNMQQAMMAASQGQLPESGQTLDLAGNPAGGTNTVTPNT